MKHALLLCLGLFGLLPAARAQEENHAHATLYARAEGEDVKVAIEVKIERGWHLYHGPTKADLGTPDAVGQPTTVDLKGQGFTWSDIKIENKPSPEKQDFGDGNPQTIYEHRGTIVIHARGKSEKNAELASINADVAGLTCKDEEGGICLPYAETLKFKGAGRDDLFARFPSTLAAGASATSDPAPSTTEGSQAPLAAEETGLLLFLLSAVGWGLFTLLMPCTYPMIPITISYFTKQAAQRKTSVLPLSITYGAGIVLIFVLIGVAIGPPIITFAAHPITNLVIGVLFLFFSLTLFGMFNLQPPAFMLNIAGQASMKGGYVGVFLMGATLVVTSFTCTAPIVGALLSTGATSGNFTRVALGMAVFGTTMAVPFVLLSLLPGKVKAMPRSGEWMHVLKVTLGFVEIAAALKFISNVDLVWGWGWLSRELFLFLWFGILLAAALYLFGLIRLKDEGPGEIAPGRMVAGLFFFLFSIYCGYGALGHSMDPLMTAFIPPYSTRIAQAGVETGTPRTGWTIIKDDYDAALAQAQRENKPLLVNFTGFT